MCHPEEVDVLIVGAGPAGMSTALHLVQANGAWSQRVVVLDKAVHPREKVCGGGLTQLGERVLQNLGLKMDIPFLPINRLQFVYQDQAYAVCDDPVFWIVQRNEFDHWLIQSGERRGICVRQGEAVVQVLPREGFVEVVTDRATFHAKVVVAADGSCSGVRQQLKMTNPGRMSRLLEVITDVEETSAFDEGVATFDFSRMAAGLQGYCWDFPNRIKGRPFMNRGVFDSRICGNRSSVLLKEELRDALKTRSCDLNKESLKGFPIYRFDTHGTFSRPRLILAGDAAGADPLLGEGISFALGYGEVAAVAIIEAFDRDNFSFIDYRHQIMKHPFLSQLVVRTRLARLVYRLKSSRLIGLGWRLAPLLVRILASLKPECIPVKNPRLRQVHWR